MSATTIPEGPARRVGVGPLLLLCVTFLAQGCCLLRPGPPPAPLPARQVIEAVRARSASFRTVTDTNISLSITTRVDGKPKKLPRLGGLVAFNAALPGLWLDAEKMTRRVFTLKALRSQFWLKLYKSREMFIGSEAAYERMPELVRPGEVRSLFAEPEVLGLSWPDTRMVVEPDDYRFDVRIGGALRRQVYVDRRQLVLSGIRRYDALGRLQTEVRLGDYGRSGGTLFPRRLTVRRPQSGTTIVLRLDEPKLDKVLPEETFIMRPEVGWKVYDLDREDVSGIPLLGAD